MKSLKRQLNDKERVEFAKHVEYFFEASYGNWRRVLTLSLLKGLASGFGIVLGGTIVVGLLLWLLGAVGEIPVLGEGADTVRETIEGGAEN